MENVEQVAQEGPTAEPSSPEQEFVPINEASDEELDAFLKSPPEDLQEQPEEREVHEPLTHTAKPEQAASADAGTQKPQEAAQTDTEQAPQGREEAEALRRENQDLKTRIQQSAEQIKQQELFIKRRGTELGEARRQLQDLRSQLQARIQQAADEGDALSAVDDKLALREVEGRLNQVDAEEGQLRNEVHARELLSRHLGEDVDVDAMAQSLIEDGIDPGYVQHFKQNPLRAGDPVTVLHLAKRARAEKVAKQLYQFGVAQFNENKQLKAELAKARGSSHTAVRNIERALKTPPTVTAASGGATSDADSYPEDLSKLSDAELNELLKNRR